MRTQTLWKAIAALGGAGLGGATFFFQPVHSEHRSSGPVDTDILRQQNPGWSWDSNWDKRDPEYRFLARRYPRGIKKLRAITQEDRDKFEEVKPKAKRNIFLIRHGQYHQLPRAVDWSFSRHDSEQKLTALGKKQAEGTGKRLKEIVQTFDCYIVSNMTRALETAAIIGNQLCLDSKTSFDSDPLLSEGSPIEPDPPNHRHPPLWYYKDGMRIEAAFRKYFHRADPEQEQDSFEVIVCHANVIRYFCCRALQFPPERWLRMSLAHGSITHLQISPDGDVTLFAIGDSSHLPRDQVTTK